MLAKLSGNNALMVQLLYGGGLRISELLRLRVQDIDFDYAKLRCVIARVTRVE